MSDNLAHHHHSTSGISEKNLLAAVVLKGEGGVFVAGADIAELNARGLAEALASINGSLMSRWASIAR